MAGVLQGQALAVQQKEPLLRTEVVVNATRAVFVIVLGHKGDCGGPAQATQNRIEECGLAHAGLAQNADDAQRSLVGDPRHINQRKVLAGDLDERSAHFSC